jgi:hypothetical protein
VAVVLPDTIPGPDHTTEVLVLTGVTIAFAVVVLQANEPDDEEAILIVLVLADTEKEPNDVHPLDVLVAV